MKNPLDDNQYDSNDEQIEDLKDALEACVDDLQRAIIALNSAPSFKIPAMSTTSYKLLPTLGTWLNRLKPS